MKLEDQIQETKSTRKNTTNFKNWNHSKFSKYANVIKWKFYKF